MHRLMCFDESHLALALIWGGMQHIVSICTMVLNSDIRIYICMECYTTVTGEVNDREKGLQS